MGAWAGGATAVLAFGSAVASISRLWRIDLICHIEGSLHLEQGGDVVVELDGREIRIRTVGEVIARAQASTRRLIGGNPDSSVAAFLAERRREAENE